MAAIEPQKHDDGGQSSQNERQNNRELPIHSHRNRQSVRPATAVIEPQSYNSRSGVENRQRRTRLMEIDRAPASQTRHKYNSPAKALNPLRDWRSAAWVAKGDHTLRRNTNSGSPSQLRTKREGKKDPLKDGIPGLADGVDM